MRIIDSILLKENLLAKSERDANIAALCRQVEYYLQNNVEFGDGVSLIPVWDLLKPSLAAKGYHEDDLTKKGFILTTKQFIENAKKVCELADSEPFIYNSRLKRLHQAYTVFIKNHAEGLLENAEVKKEIQSEFSDILHSYYSENFSESSFVPKDLKVQLEKLLESCLDNLILQWLNKTLSSEIDQELTDLFTRQFISDMREDKLPLLVQQKLNYERSHSQANLISNNNARLRLLEHFQSRRLSLNIQKMIQSEVVTEITTDINSGKITTSTPLGAAYQKIKSSELKGRNYIIPKMIENWQNAQLDAQASLELEEYVTKIIEKRIASQEFGLVQQFEQLSIEIFIEEIRGEKHTEDLTQVVQRYLQEMGKTMMTLDQHEAYPLCANAILNNAIMEAYEAWISGRMSVETSHFLQDKIFEPLHEIDILVQERIWRNRLTIQSADTQREVADLRAELSKTRQSLDELTKWVKQYQKSSAAEQLVSPTPEEEIVDSKSPKSTLGNFFRS